MGERHNDKYRITRDFSGEEIKLTLVLKEEWPDKKNDLYTVCKIKDGKNIPLYDETFTPEQVNVFYTNATYYVAIIPDDYIPPKRKEEVKEKFIPSKKSIKREVYQYDLDGNLIKKWESRTEASKALGIHYDNISQCCCGRQKTAKGYIWSNELIEKEN